MRLEVFYTTLLLLFWGEVWDYMMVRTDPTQRFLTCFQNAFHCFFTRVPPGLCYYSSAVSVCASQSCLRRHHAAEVCIAHGIQGDMRVACTLACMCAGRLVQTLIMYFYHSCMPISRFYCIFSDPKIARWRHQSVTASVWVWAGFIILWKQVLSKAFLIMSESICYPL